MENTPNIVAPLWDAAQASPWIPHNKGFRIFDAFALATTVESRASSAPPGSCADGARYLVAAGASGAWAGQTGKLAIAVGVNAASGWYFATVALSGMTIFVRDESPTVTRYYSGAWHDFVDGLSRFQDLIDVSLTGLVDGDVFVWDASNGQLFPQTIANLVNPLLAPYVQGTLDTDGTLAANSDSRVASQKAVRTYVAATVLGMFDLRGSTDCSANPNYPAASKGDTYVVTVAGKIGGASGTSVAAGDIYFATADNAGGTQGAVGSSWDVILHAGSLSGALLAANNLSDVANAGTARTNLGATTVGGNVFTLTNPGAITFLRVNADNSVSALSASAFRTAIGAGTGSGSGDLLSTNNLSDLANAGTARTNLGATTAGSNLFTLANPGAITFLRVNADNTVSALSAASFRTAIGAGTGSGDLLAANNLSDVANAATAGANIRPVESLIVACSDETTALATGTGKVTFRMPYAFTLTDVRASLVTAQASGSIFTINVKESGTTIFSTKPTIDNTEKTTTTAATPAVISDASLADDAEMTVDIDQIGDGTAKGLKIILIGHRT